MDSMSARTSQVNTPIGALVTMAMVDNVMQPATAVNTPIGALVTTVARNVGANYASSTNTVPSMDGRSRPIPLPLHAVGKSADQPSRSLLQPQQGQGRLYVLHAETSP
jgi:hypothetical protein